MGRAPPASAQASLQNHVTRLRRLLDDPDRLRAMPPGYLLRVGEGELDVRVFESHVTAARAAHAGRDGERRCARPSRRSRGCAAHRSTGLAPELGGHALVQRLEEAAARPGVPVRGRVAACGAGAGRVFAGGVRGNAGDTAHAGGTGDTAHAGGTGGTGVGWVFGDIGEISDIGNTGVSADAKATDATGAPHTSGSPGTTRLAALAPELSALVAEHPCARPSTGC